MKASLLRLIVLLAVLALVSGLGLLRVELGTPITLAGGALLLCGIFAGKVAVHVGLPRLTGYLLIGILVGPYVLRFIPTDGVKGLELVKGLAVSLIALAAGTELRLGLVRRVGARVASLCAAVCFVVFATVMATLMAARPLLPFLAEVPLMTAIPISALVAAVIISFSPTVTIAIVQETGARGPFTEFLMSFVIIGDLFVLVVFALCAAWSEAALGGAFDVGGIMGGIVWELFGSMAFGALVGVGALVYLKKVGREIPLFIISICFLSAQTSTHLHLSPLLLMLAAGALIANLDEHESERLHGAINVAGLPVFALFFAAVGAGLALNVLVAVGPVAVALALVRAGSIWAACRRFTRKDEQVLKSNLWLGLVSQAGVTFGLAALIAATFPTFGREVETLIIALATLNELIGPLLIRRALYRAEEVPPADSVQARSHAAH